MFTYPTAADAIPAIQRIIKDVTTGAVAADRQVAAFDGCCAISFVSSQVFGTPPSAGGGTGGFTASSPPRMENVPELTNDQACAMLQSVVQSSEAGETNMMALPVN